MSETNMTHEKEPVVTAEPPSTAPPKETSSPQVPVEESNGLRLLKAIRDRAWVGLVVVLPKLENAERCAEREVAYANTLAHLLFMRTSIPNAALCKLVDEGHYRDLLLSLIHI